MPECQGTPCSKQAPYLNFKWEQRDLNQQPLGLYYKEWQAAMLSNQVCQLTRRMLSTIKLLAGCSDTRWRDATYWLRFEWTCWQWLWDDCGLWVLDFCVANKLAVANTFFQKNISRLITYSSRGNQTQIDYILIIRSNPKNIKDLKTISSEEYNVQHESFVCNLIVSAKPLKPIHIPSRRKT